MTEQQEEAVRHAIYVLSEVRTGEDFEGVCCEAAEALRKAFDIPEDIE